MRAKIKLPILHGEAQHSPPSIVDPCSEAKGSKVPRPVPAVKRTIKRSEGE